MSTLRARFARSVVHTVMIAFLSLGLVLVTPDLSYAASPTIIVGFWDWSLGCVTYTYNVFKSDVDTFTRDALPHEAYPDWHPESLRANAVLIRSAAHFFYLYPEYNDPQVCKQPGVGFFNLRTSRVQGWKGGRGARLGIIDNITNDKVTDTGSQVLRLNGTYFYTPFNDCLQNYTQQLALQGRGYVSIVTAADGVYGPNRPPEYNCGMPTYTSGLSVNSAYPWSYSMTNGTEPYPVSGGQRTDEVTNPFATRQAERWWGHFAIEYVVSGPFGQPGIYAKGEKQGAKTEYLMIFGGYIAPYMNIYGIADIPAPVTMNIYIDGYYKGQLNWSQGDNARHWTGSSYYYVPYTTHAVAIEFYNDLWQSPGGEPNDRNFYVDELFTSP